MPITEQDVLSALKSCYDPEIPVNIVDLGLIYKVGFANAPVDDPKEAKQAVTEQDVLSALKSCYDPEIPVNIVDLGLIYKVGFANAPVDDPKEAKQDVT